MTVQGTVLKVLDSKRLIADIGSTAGVERSMEFEVYVEIEVSPRHGSYSQRKATLIPSDIMNEMTVMKTKSKWRQFDFSALSNFVIGSSVQDKMEVENTVPEDIMIVRKGDPIREVEEEEEESGADMVYEVGEKPGSGTYCCTNCDWKINVEDPSDTLPPCGNCGAGHATEYTDC